MSKLTPLERAGYWDSKKEGKSKVHFTPRRRGPAKNNWPLAPKKALIKLTGRTPLSRALVALKHFLVARFAHWKTPPWRSDKIREMYLDEPWTEAWFRETAKEYLLYPRKGFNAAKQKERISKVLRELGLK